MPIDMKTRAAIIVAALAVLAGCGQTETIYPTRRDGDTRPTWSNEEPQETVFGPGGLTLFGGPSQKDKDAASAGIGVNAFLWRASLDTIGFMPLTSADPFGGVIITDWYQPPETPNERFKLSVFILDRTLRADGVRVSVFRQMRKGPGEWADAAVDKKTATDMENAILTRAREMRSAAKAAQAK